MRYLPQWLFKRLVETKDWRPVCKGYLIGRDVGCGKMILGFADHPFETKCSIKNGNKILNAYLER